MRIKRTRTRLSILFLLGMVSMAFLSHAAQDFAPPSPDHFSVSAGRLGEVLQGELRNGRADISNAAPPLNGLPPYLRYTFDEDELSDDINFLERQLVIIPVDSYRALFHKKKKKMFDRRLEIFRYVITNNIAENFKEIPVFPPVVPLQRFHSQIQSLNFQKGKGIRFLSGYSMTEDTPITAKDIFYTFQGMTKDGKYIVVFFYPVMVRNLPISQDAGMAALYLDQIPPENFSPPLGQLDNIVQSITFESKTFRPSPK